MVIANPIYDVVFKRMMENERVARFFISTLLDEPVESVEVKPQEFTYTNTISILTVFRLDFVATIKTGDGSFKKILIEIQKARNHIDLIRFRNYLADQYRREDLVNGEKVVLPITTIYILGFRLPEIPTPCVKIERNYKNRLDDSLLNVKSDFVEKLTHDSFIVQVDRITDNYQTRLDKLLSVFEQKNFLDEGKTIKEYNHNTDVEEVKIMTDILHHTGTNPEEKQQIEIEQEAWRTFDAATGDVRKVNEKLIKELEGKDLELLEKDKLIESLMKQIKDKE